MRAGRLRKRVMIERPTPQTDSFGQPRTAWTEVAQVWAEIVPAGGDESLRARVTQGEITHRVTLRYTPDLPGPECRIRWVDIGNHSRVFNIINRLNYNEINRELDCLCKEMV